MKKSRYVRVLTIRLVDDISPREVTLFRGAVLNHMGNKADLLFHNHTGDNTFRYSYPFIQYKCLGGKASIVCVEKGIDIIGLFLSEANGKLVIGEREIECEIKNVKPTRVLVQTWDTLFNYHLVRWLPLNSKNYQKYKTIEGVTERISFLESILKANLLAILKGLDIRLDTELKVTFTQLSEPYLVRFKTTKLMAFNVDFKSNLSIPNNIGVGKNASIGYGVIMQEH